MWFTLNHFISFGHEIFPSSARYKFSLHVCSYLKSGCKTLSSFVKIRPKWPGSWKIWMRSMCTGRFLKWISWNAGNLSTEVLERPILIIGRFLGILRKKSGCIRIYRVHLDHKTRQNASASEAIRFDHVRCARKRDWVKSSHERAGIALRRIRRFE